MKRRKLRKWVKYTLISSLMMLFIAYELNMVNLINNNQEAYNRFKSSVMEHK